MVLHGKKEIHLTPVTLRHKNTITGPADIFQYEGSNPTETTALRTMPSHTRVYDHDKLITQRCIPLTPAHPPNATPKFLCDLLRPKDPTDPLQQALGNAAEIIQHLQHRSDTDKAALLAPMELEPKVASAFTAKFTTPQKPADMTQTDLETSAAMTQLLMEGLEYLGPPEHHNQPGTKLCCTCLLTGNKLKCSAPSNDVGLHSPSNTLFSLCYFPEDHGEDPVTKEYNKPTDEHQCVCGDISATKDARDKHAARTRTGGAHGCTPEELPALGGAHSVSNTETGTVLDAHAYPLPNIGAALNHSTRVESATIVNLVASITRLITSGKIPRNTPVAISTDSQASADGYKSQVEKPITVPKRTKSSIQDHMENLKTTCTTILKDHGTTISVKQQNNEHGRPWNYPHRDHFLVSANAASDRAAGKAANTTDNRFAPCAKTHGSSAVLAKAGAIIYHDIKEVLTATADAAPTHTLLNTRDSRGDNARALQHGSIDTEASAEAYKKALGATKRTMALTRLNRGHFNMQTLDLTARKDRNKALSRTLGKCGHYSSYCPWCFNLSHGTGSLDTANHGRDACTHHTAKAAQRRRKAIVLEAWAREGRAGHANMDYGDRCTGPWMRTTVTWAAQPPPHTPCPWPRTMVTTIDTTAFTGSTRDYTVTEPARGEPIATISDPNTQHPPITMDIPRLHTLTIMRKQPQPNTPAQPFAHQATSLLVTAHRARSTRAPGALGKLTVHVPSALLGFMHLNLKLERQRLISPLFLTTGIFQEVDPTTTQGHIVLRSVVPTFMPGSTDTITAANTWHPQEEQLNTTWTATPWDSSTFVALGAGDPTDLTEPDPDFKALATNLLQKSIISAQQGLNTGLLLELSPCKLKTSETDLLQKKFTQTQNKTRGRTHRAKIRILTSFPPGTFANFYRGNDWQALDADTIAPLTHGNYREPDNPKTTPTTNRYPVTLIWISSYTDMTIQNLTKAELRSLALTIANFAPPQRALRPDKPIMWLGHSGATPLSLRLADFPPGNFSSDDTKPNQPLEEMLRSDGGTALKTTTDYFIRFTANGKLKTPPHNTNVRLTLTNATAHATTIGKMEATRIATLCLALGTPVGSLRALTNKQGHKTHPCPCCGTETSTGFPIPPAPETQANLPHVIAAQTLRSKALTLYCKRAMPQWPAPPAPSTHPARTTGTAHLQRTQSTPASRPQVQTLTRAASAPAPADDQQQRQTWPKDLLRTIWGFLNQRPLLACLPCALQYITPLKRHLDPPFGLRKQTNTLHGTSCAPS